MNPWFLRFADVEGRKKSISFYAEAQNQTNNGMVLALN